MNPETMRVKIAEAMGWKFTPTPKGGACTANWQAPSGRYTAHCPDPTIDERHAFQAVEWLRREKGMEVRIESAGIWYVSFSDGTTYPPVEITNQYLPLAICEAFLKCLSLWT